MAWQSAQLHSLNLPQDGKSPVGLAWVAVKTVKPWQSVMPGPFLFLVVSFCLTGIWPKAAGKEVLGEEVFFSACSNS